MKRKPSSPPLHASFQNTPKFDVNYRALNQNLGSGTFGYVMMAYDMRDKCNVAVKVFKRIERQCDMLAMREISALRRLRHENIVRLIDVVKDDSDNICMVMELCTNDLDSLIRAGNCQFWHAGQVKGYMHQLLLALQFCHESRMIHRDLKPNNILITSDNCVKLADFGMSHDHMPEFSSYTNCVTTLPYRDPQLLMGTRAYGCEIDVWSFACIFGELLFCSKLFPACMNSEGKEDQTMQWSCILALCGSPLEADDKFWPSDVHAGLKKWRMAKPVLPRVLGRKLGKDNCLVERKRFFTPAAVALLDSLLEMAPLKRLTVAQILEHDYFAKEGPRPFKANMMMPQEKVIPPQSQPQPVRAGVGGGQKKIKV